MAKDTLLGFLEWKLWYWVDWGLSLGKGAPNALGNYPMEQEGSSSVASLLGASRRLCDEPVTQPAPSPSSGDSWSPDWGSHNELF